MLYFLKLVSIEGDLQMKITYLIGNGFDLNMKMKTGYKDFLKYYLRQKSKDVFINKVKLEIKQNLDNWSDLEISLGKFSSKFNNQQTFISFIDDICINLAKYLRKEEEKYDFIFADKDKVINDFIMPESYL